ncbi:hypothetical protein BGZ65_012550 [Modicella reniformis]|uniref:Uncharacterized protein n=1 Tax=Modicella reniformis TaxID=1440133 RepID=A0A9P6IQ41_9FUNG|nr:hypothetical protein BGZ65_012550 [Modicella reniformis]
MAAPVAVSLLPDGFYRLHNGGLHNPGSWYYVTAEPNAGLVSLLPKSETAFQVWQLRNHLNGQVSLEVRGKPGYYLTPGGSGALAGEPLGVTQTQQMWDFGKFAGGPFTRYYLAYPEPILGKTLLVSEGTELESVIFTNQEGGVTATQAWKFAPAA